MIPIDDEPYQARMSEDFHPWRRNMRFFDSRPAPIRPLIERLEFIKQKDRWGAPFRRGLFSIGSEDFRLILEAMASRIES